MHHVMFINCQRMYSSHDAAANAADNQKHAAKPTTTELGSRNEYKAPDRSVPRDTIKGIRRKI